MSRGQRIGLLAAAVAIAVVAFVIAKPGSDDSSKSGSPSKRAGPASFRIQLKNHKPVGRKVIKVKTGDRVLIVVSSDKPETVHLHGYEIEREITPSKPGRYAFTAKNEGAYDLESHTTEKKIATLQVQPR
jgi:hypothetical protein